MVVEEVELLTLQQLCLKVEMVAVAMEHQVQLLQLVESQRMELTDVVAVEVVPMVMEPLELLLLEETAEMVS
jgi:hypothetical protein